MIILLWRVSIREILRQAVTTPNRMPSYRYRKTIAFAGLKASGFTTGGEEWYLRAPAGISDGMQPVRLMASIIIP